MNPVARWTITVPACSLALAFCLVSPAQEETLRPEEIPDLEAWYRVDSLRGKLGEKFTVVKWPDSSGNGHHLESATPDRAGVLKEGRVNDLDVVVGDAGHLAVESPFDLDDHTIFLVARSKHSDQAFFSSDTHKTRGILLFQNGSRHTMRVGAVGTTSPSYTDPTRRKNEFDIVVLARKSGVMRAWAGGTDVSSWARDAHTLRVARLFTIKMSTFVDRDARGLEVGEMLFYSRFLEDDERHGVASYLSSRFNLPLALPVAVPLAERVERLTSATGTKLAWIRTADPGDLNGNDKVGHRVQWHGSERKQPYLEHQAGEQGSRIKCTADDTRVYMYLVLPVTSTDAGVSLRALVLLNGEEYLPDDAVTQVFGGAGDAGSTMLELETVLTLKAGDYFEIVTFRHGAEGKVVLGPEPMGLVFERR